MLKKLTIAIGHLVVEPPELKDATTPAERCEIMDAHHYKAHSISRWGHWKRETIAKACIAEGFVGDVKVFHSYLDGTGKGRGSMTLAFTLYL